MQKKKYFFSIITPVLNDIRIKKNIKSLSDQKYKNFEHIIIDGGSSDSTIKILKKIKSKRTKVILSKKDKGIYDAMNKGIKASKGEIIGILNADDIYYKNTLSIVNNYFQSNKIDYLFGNVMKKRLHHGFWPNKIWWKFNIFPSHSCGFFIKKSLHKKIGLYDINFKHSADRDLVFRIIIKNHPGLCAEKKHIFGKFNPYGISSKVGILNDLKEQFLIRLKNKQNILFLIFLFLLTFLYKVTRKMLNLKSE